MARDRDGLCARYSKIGGGGLIPISESGEPTCSHSDSEEWSSCSTPFNVYFKGHF